MVAELVTAANETTQTPEILNASEPKTTEEPGTSSENNLDNTLQIKNPGFTPPNPQSKRQLKRLKKQAAYQTIRKEKRLKEREKLKEKRRLAIAQGLPAQAGPSRKELKKRQAALCDKTASVKIAIDLDYDKLMSDHDIAKCIKQCLRMYTINRRSDNPAELNFTGLQKEGRIHSAFKRHDGWENWNVNYHFDKNHIEAFEHDNLVYLTCESDNVLDELESNKIYVIGGLVDHNHFKGFCHERATKAGLKTARLPLSEYVEMKTREVLSTYHVFELLLHVAGGASWTDAILATIPMRKNAKPKEALNEGSSSTTNNDDIVDLKSDNDKVVV